MFGHMHGVLNKIYLQNFLHGWIVRASPTVCQIRLPSLFFWKNTKNMSPTVLHTTWQILESWQKVVLNAQICARVSGSPSVFLAPRTPPARLPVVLLPRVSPSSFSRATHSPASTSSPPPPTSSRTTLNGTAQRAAYVRVRLRLHQEGVRDGAGHGDAAAAIHSTNGRPADAQVPTSLNRFLPFLVF